MDDIALICRLLEWIERQIHLWGVNGEVEIASLIGKIRAIFKEKKND